MKPKTPDRMKNLPPEIYLNIGDDCPADTDFRELAEVTWCEQRTGPADIRYTLPSRWIPVGESLPELDRRVLAYRELGGIRSIYIARRIPHDRTDPANPHWHWTQVVNDSEIKAWMPLPDYPAK